MRIPIDAQNTKQHQVSRLPHVPYSKHPSHQINDMICVLCSFYTFLLCTIYTVVLCSLRGLSCLLCPRVMFTLQMVLSCTLQCFVMFVKYRVLPFSLYTRFCHILNTQSSVMFVKHMFLSLLLDTQFSHIRYT